MVSPSQFFFHLEICIGITINVKKHSTRKFSTEISPGFLKFHLARIARIPVFSGHVWGAIGITRFEMYILTCMEPFEL